MPLPPRVQITYLVAGLVGVVMLVALCVVGTLLALKFSGDGGTPRRVAGEGEEGENISGEVRGRTYGPSEPIEAHGVRVTFRRAVVMRLIGAQGNDNVQDVLLRVEYDLENPSAVKVVAWDGWQSRCRVTDEHGNVFGSFTVARSFRIDLRSDNGAVAVGDTVATG